MKRFRQFGMTIVAITMGTIVAGSFADEAGGTHSGEPSSAGPNVKLWEWEKGVAVESLDQKGMTVYLWFYEWNMFDARQRGVHTSGTYRMNRRLTEDERTATIKARDMRLVIQAATDGAELRLEITNQTEHHWPAIAGIIPCFNPGAPKNQAKQFPRARLNPQFDNHNTWYVRQQGLQRLERREIHFNHALRTQVNNAATDGRYAFSHKWPTSDEDAHAGLMVRESVDGKWVMGIAWERFLSAQGHNPWQCMHLCINVGPLAPSRSRTVRGRIYLFRGTKEQCLDRWRRDFGNG